MLRGPYGAANPTFTASYGWYVHGDHNGLPRAQDHLRLRPSRRLTFATITMALLVEREANRQRQVLFQLTVNICGTQTFTFKPESVPASGTACNGAYSGTFSGNLTVSPAQTCIFERAASRGTLRKRAATSSLAATCRRQRHHQRRHVFHRALDHDQGQPENPEHSRRTQAQNQILRRASRRRAT